MCNSSFWDRVESCDIKTYKTACIPESETTMATWWTGASDCNPGFVKFTEKEAAKEFLGKNKAAHDAKTATTSMTAYLNDVSEYCHVVMKETFIASMNFEARLDKGSVFLISSYERPMFGDPAGFGIQVDRDAAFQSTKVPIDKVESNCAESFIKGASFTAYQSIVGKSMKLFADEALTQEVCTLAAGTKIKLDYDCDFDTQSCTFSGNSLQSVCGVSQAYGLNHLVDALQVPKAP
jgi:hypothetical protein